VNNEATVSGKTPAGADVSGTGTNVYPYSSSPQLTVDKSGVVNDSDGDGVIEVGEKIDYTIVVTNTGNVTVNGITVDDPLVGPIVCDLSALFPGQVTTCRVTYTLTQADVDAGTVSNTATCPARAAPSTKSSASRRSR
jgi:hypothetical protein